MTTRISGRLDPVTGAERPGDWLTDGHGEALVYVVALPRAATPADLGRDLAADGQSMGLGAVGSRGRLLLRALEARGLVESPSWGRYLPTERGRIVAALHMARRPWMADAFFDDGPAAPPSRVRPRGRPPREAALAKLRPAFSALTPDERRALGPSVSLGDLS